MAIFASRSILKVDSPQNGVFAIASANFEDGLLNLFFFALIFAVNESLFFEVGVIGKEIGLGKIGFGICCGEFG